MFIGMRLDADGSGMMMTQRLENEGSEAAGVGNKSVRMYMYFCMILEPVVDQPGLVKHTEFNQAKFFKDRGGEMKLVTDEDVITMCLGRHMMALARASTALPAPSS